MPVNKQSVQDLVIEGELGKAIKQLLELGKAFSSDLLNETTLLSARFNALERDKRAGLISNDNSTMRFAQIGASLNYLVDKVKPEWSLDIDMGDGGGGGVAAPPKKESGKQVILFLGANPSDTTKLRLGEEVRDIDTALRMSKYRDNFQLVSKWAVRIPDLQQALLDEEPSILHFSGHGSELGHIYLEDVSGKGKEVHARALAGLLELFKEQLKCVVLNACYSEIQAKEIAKHGIPVVGMNTAVPDKAAIAFSDAFYRGLGAGRDIEFAYKLGCAAINLYDLKAEDIPVLIKP